MLFAGPALGAELTLSEALALAASKNPELQAYSWEVRAADGQRAYASLPPNPELSIELEDFLGTGVLAGFRGAQTTLHVSQALELGAKRRARTAVAQGNLGVVESEYAVRRLTVLSETSIRFVHVVADQHRLTVARQARALAEAGLAAARHRVVSGGASSVEEKRAGILLARAKIEEEHAEHELLASRRRLAAQWGETEPTFEQASAELFERRQLPTYEALAARIESNPELVKLVKIQAARDTELSLAESQALPDLRASVGARRLEGPDAFGVVLGISTPLPLFQRNQGAILAADARRMQVQADREASRVRILASLYGQYQELVHAATELTAIERDVLPNAESLLELLNAGFAVGRFSQLEVLDAQRTLIDVRREHIMAAEELYTFAVRVEALLGASLDGGDGD